MDHLNSYSLGRKFSRRLKILIYLMILIIITQYFVSLWTHSVRQTLMKGLSSRNVETPPIVIGTNDRSYNWLQFSKFTGDEQRTVKIYHWSWPAESLNSLMDQFDVCLSTQTSVHRLHWVPQVVRKWKGPVSLAVLVNNPAEWMSLNVLVASYRSCFQEFRDFVSIHVVIPRKEGKGLVVAKHSDYEAMVKEYMEKETKFAKERICSSNEEDIGNLLKYFRTKDADAGNREKMLPYPRNQMENVARESCGTDWVLATDIDIIPMQNLSGLLQEFYETKEAKECSGCAYVIPTFEVSEKKPFPETKALLLDYWNNDNARPLLSGPTVSSPAHSATNYDTWKKKKDLDTGGSNGDSVVPSISHDADPERMDAYEPFYISSGTISVVNERFLGYRFNRSSQTQAALAEGWTFKVLSPIFLVHWGLQEKGTLKRTGNSLSLKKAHSKHNLKLFDDLMDEMTSWSKQGKDNYTDKCAS